MQKAGRSPSAFSQRGSPPRRSLPRAVGNPKEGVSLVCPATQHRCEAKDRAASSTRSDEASGELKGSISLKGVSQDFPGDPVVKTLLFQGTQVRSLVGEMRSHMTCGQ